MKQLLYVILMLIIHACVPQNKTNGLKDRRTYVDYLDSIIQIEEMHLGASKDTFINLKNAGNEPFSSASYVTVSSNGAPGRTGSLL